MQQMWMAVQAVLEHNKVLYFQEDLEKIMEDTVEEQLQAIAAKAEAEKKRIEQASRKAAGWLEQGDIAIAEAVAELLTRSQPNAEAVAEQLENEATAEQLNTVAAAEQLDDKATTEQLENEATTEQDDDASSGGGVDDDDADAESSAGVD
jgi:hypothetical protein